MSHRCGGTVLGKDDAAEHRVRRGRTVQGIQSRVGWPGSSRPTRSTYKGLGGLCTGLYPQKGGGARGMASGGALTGADAVNPSVQGYLAHKKMPPRRTLQ